ncbi:MAG: 23S rRNA (pseudouridine(1915)-N(3))-methyltransferase RlmH [Bacteroidales bacterium]|nr:23S rRNA (pseudouridine(1915)-N(3))-methyltransferase RlmH [Bacteroidales bacterium]MDD4640987.1 23S rRNA (pseudouridine(1915)-N(3))-methyltransferase RlmH [Bacteroidales bacterium]NLB03359.1 23S rRNA (pseudouridine(1915)-N(3))-methyltransferase RlmH [Bacteroidales bacterium]
MKIVFLLTGKTSEDYARKSIKLFEERLKHYLPFEIVCLPELKNSGKISEQEQKQREAALLEPWIKAENALVLLDERGKEYTSEAFATHLQKKMNAGLRNLVFVCGGPYGFDESVYRRIPERLSLSKMTFSHQMVRVFFVEQLYRAMTILRGEPYHHA